MCYTARVTVDFLVELTLGVLRLTGQHHVRCQTIYTAQSGISPEFTELGTPGKIQ